MKVRLLTAMLFDSRHNDAGAILDVADDLAKDWTKRRLASEKLDAPAPKPAVTIAALEARIVDLERKLAAAEEENATLRARSDANRKRAAAELEAEVARAKRSDAPKASAGAAG